MWLGVLVGVLILAYLIYRFSFSVRSIRARRAGDRDRADELSTNGRMVFLGLTGIATLLMLVWVVVLVATH